MLILNNWPVEPLKVAVNAKIIENYVNSGRGDLLLEAAGDLEKSVQGLEKLINDLISLLNDVDSGAFGNVVAQLQNSLARIGKIDFTGVSDEFTYKELATLKQSGGPNPSTVGMEAAFVNKISNGIKDAVIGIGEWLDGNPVFTIGNQGVTIAPEFVALKSPNVDPGMELLASGIPGLHEFIGADTEEAAIEKLMPVYDQSKLATEEDIRSEYEIVAAAFKALEDNAASAYSEIEKKLSQNEASPDFENELDMDQGFFAALKSVFFGAISGGGDSAEAPPNLEGAIIKDILGDSPKSAGGKGIFSLTLNNYQKLVSNLINAVKAANEATKNVGKAVADSANEPSDAQKSIAKALQELGLDSDQQIATGAAFEEAGGKAESPKSVDQDKLKSLLAKLDFNEEQILAIVAVLLGEDPEEAKKPQIKSFSDEVSDPEVWKSIKYQLRSPTITYPEEASVEQFKEVITKFLNTRDPLEDIEIAVLDSDEYIKLADLPKDFPVTQEDIQGVYQEFIDSGNEPDELPPELEQEIQDAENHIQQIANDIANLGNLPPEEIEQAVQSLEQENQEELEDQLQALETFEDEDKYEEYIPPKQPSVNRDRAEQTLEKLKIKDEEFRDFSFTKAYKELPEYKEYMEHFEFEEGVYAQQSEDPTAAKIQSKFASIIFGKDSPLLTLMEEEEKLYADLMQKKHIAKMAKYSTVEKDDQIAAALDGLESGYERLEKIWKTELPSALQKIIPQIKDLIAGKDNQPVHPDTEVTKEDIFSKDTEIALNNLFDKLMQLVMQNGPHVIRAIGKQWSKNKMDWDKATDEDLEEYFNTTFEQPRKDGMNKYIENVIWPTLEDSLEKEGSKWRYGKSGKDFGKNYTDLIYGPTVDAAENAAKEAPEEKSESQGPKIIKTNDFKKEMLKMDVGDAQVQFLINALEDEGLAKFETKRSLLDLLEEGIIEDLINNIKKQKAKPKKKSKILRRLDSNEKGLADYLEKEFGEDAKESNESSYKENPEGMLLERWAMLAGINNE